MFENPRRSRLERNFTKKCSENSRSQIVFRTDIFRKLTLGAPALCAVDEIFKTADSRERTNFRRAQRGK